MKRNWKRVLSIWLTVCMVFTMNFGLGAATIYAEPDNNAASENQAETTPDGNGENSGEVNTEGQGEDKTETPVSETEGTGTPSSNTLEAGNNNSSTQNQEENLPEGNDDENNEENANNNDGVVNSGTLTGGDAVNEGNEDEKSEPEEGLLGASSVAASAAAESKNITATNINVGNERTFSVSADGKDYIINLYDVKGGDDPITDKTNLTVQISINNTDNKVLEVGKIRLSGNGVITAPNNDISVKVSANAGVKFDSVKVSMDGINKEAEGKLIACESGAYEVDGETGIIGSTMNEMDDLTAGKIYYLNEGALKTTVSYVDATITMEKGFTIISSNGLSTAGDNAKIYEDMPANDKYTVSLSSDNLDTSAANAVVVKLANGGYGTIAIPAKGADATAGTIGKAVTGKDKIYFVDSDEKPVKGTSGVEYALSYNNAKPGDKDYKGEIKVGEVNLSWNGLETETEYTLYARTAAVVGTSFAGDWINLGKKGTTLEDTSKYAISDGSIKVSNVKTNGAEITLKDGVSFNGIEKKIDLDTYKIEFALVSGNDAAKDADFTGHGIEKENTTAGFTGLVPGTNYELWYRIGNKAGEFGGVNTTQPTGITVKTVKKYGVEFPKALTSVPYRSTKAIEAIIGDPEVVAYVGAAGTKITLSTNEAYAYDPSAITKVSIISGNGSLEYLSTADTGKTLYENLDSETSFTDSYDKATGGNKTISINVVYSGIDKASEDATGATSAITLTDTKVYVSACELTLTDTKLGNTKVEYTVTPAEDIQGWTEVTGKSLVSSDSAQYLAMKAFEVSGLGETVLSGNVTYNVGNGKLFIKDYTLLSANGANASWAANNDVSGIEFVNQTEANGADMTVIAKSTTLNLTVITESMYYDTFATLRDSKSVSDQRAILAKYIKASAGDADITTNGKITYKYSDKKSGFNEKFDETLKQALKAGKTIYISADYIPGNDSDSVAAGACVGISIEKQPIQITVDKVIDDILAGVDLSEKAKDYTKVSGTVTVSKNDGSDLVTPDVDPAINGAMDKWLDSSTVSLDAASIENINSKFSGEYTVEYTVSEGNLNSAISSNYTLAGGKVTGKLVIAPSVLVSFYDALTGEKLAASQAVASNAITGTLSVKLLSANGAEDKAAESWSYRRSDKDEIKELGSGYWSDSGDSDNYTYTFNNLNDATRTSYWDSESKTNKYEYISENSASLDLFVSYLTYAEPVGKGNKQTTTTGISVSISAIKPVVYTGNKLVSDSYHGAAYKYNKKEDDYDLKKGYTPALDISLSIQGGGASLIEGTDYTISYKNNTDAAKSTDKKAPTVTITGKGNYKGLKLTTTFTILPANIANLAEVQGKNRYVKYTNKAFDSKYYAVNTSNNKKLNKKSYTLNYYDENGKKVSAAAYTKALTEPTMFYVTAEAAANQNYTGETSFVKGDDEDTSIVYGIPANSKKLKVTGVNKKVDYNKSQTDPEKLFIDTLVVKDVNKPSVEYTGVNNQLYTVTYLKDDQISKVSKVDSIGTYYVSVAPKDLAAMKALGGVYEPTLVKVNYKGLKIKGAVKLAKTSIPYNTTDTTIGLVVNSKYTEYGDIKVSYPSANGTYETKTVKELGGADAKIPIYRSGGSQEVYVWGQGGYSADEVKLTYKVTAQKLKADDVTIVINNGKALPYNAAGYSAAIWNNTTIKVNSTGDTISKWYLDVAAKKTSKTGSDAGKATFTFTGDTYTGKITVPFDIEAMSFANFNDDYDNELELINDYSYSNGTTVNGSYLFGYSTLSGNDPDVELVQFDYVYNSKTDKYKYTKAVLKVNKDYTMSDFKVVSADNIVKGSVTAAKNEAYTGTKSFECYIYPKAVSKVLVTAISDNTTKGYETEVSNNRAKFKGTYEATRPVVYSVRVTYKDGSTQDYVGKTAVNKVFTTGYSNNYNIGKKAEIILAYNSGKYGPTYNKYVTYYEIVGAW